MSYCIYCDEGEDGDHRSCDELWEAAQGSFVSTDLPIPSGVTLGSVNGPFPAPHRTQEEEKR